jgi:superfamily I DNA/RNA helicase
MRFKLPPEPAPGSIAWSDEQEAIFEWFEHGEGHLLVRARAGTGKTTTLVEGVQRAPEKRICVAAFNKAIAVELQSRFRQGTIQAKTLHALGFGIIKRQLPHVDVDASGERGLELARAGVKLVAGYEEKHAPLMGELRNIANMHTKIREIIGDPLMGWPDGVAQLEIFDWLLAADASWGELSDQVFWNFERCVEAAFAAVQVAVQEPPQKGVDFADMIFLPVALGWAQPRYDLLVVDEAQDMSALQLELAQRVCKGRFALIGDDRQAIYGFRGADVGCLDRLKSELQARELTLTTTYRCPKSVVRIARKFVRDIAAHEDAKSGYVDDEIDWETLIEMVEPGDFVLSRSNAALASAYLGLLKAGVAAYIKGRDLGKRALERVVKLAKKLPKPVTFEALEKALGEWFEKRCQELDAKMHDAEKAKERKWQLQDDCTVIRAFVAGSVDYDDLLKRLKACGSGDDLPVRSDMVMCSTVHKAKGLEAKRVWLLGSSFHGNADEASEESNICYVAVTRSKGELFLEGKTWDDFFYSPPPWLDGAADAAQAARDVFNVED